MPETKSKFLIPAIGAVVVVAAGIAVYTYLRSGPSGDISGAIESANIVPDEAFMATYISTDPKVWSKLEQFGTPEAQKVVAKGLKDFDQNFLSNFVNSSNLSYEKDLKPWVGGVMLAMLPANPTREVQNSPQAASSPSILMVIGIKDKLSALNFANKLKEQTKDAKIQEIDYKGQNILEITDQGTPRYSAVLKDHVLLTDQRQTIEKAIDTVQGEPSFAERENAKTILARGVNVENTVAQIYVPDYADMVQQLVATNPQPTALPPNTLTQLRQVQSMVAGVGIDDVGLRMKAIANLDPKVTTFQYQNTSSQVLSQLPSDTIALLSGQGISSWWSTFVKQSKDSPEYNQALQQVRAQLQQVNLDLDKEIFGWMNGEFAFAAIPSNQGVLAQIGFGGAFLFKTSDRQTAEATLAKIDNLAKQQSINVATREINGQNVTEWQIPLQGALLSHGWLNNDTVFIALGGPLAEVLTNLPSQSLNNSEKFKAVIDTLQKPNGGYFYLDMPQTISLLNRFSAIQQQPIPPENKVLLNSIRGVGITATSPDKSTSQVEFLLALEPKTE